MFVLGGVTIRSRCLVSAALCLASIFGPTTFAQVRPIPLAPSVAEEPSTTTPPSEREPLAGSARASGFFDFSAFDFSVF
ncbi:MAG: hypothetical protein R3C56_07390 [Pirellulaceae bacterium]